jgi:hypothetical protein
MGTCLKQGNFAVSWSHSKVGHSQCTLASGQPSNEAWLRCGSDTAAYTQQPNTSKSRNICVFRTPAALRKHFTSQYHTCRTIKTTLWRSLPQVSKSRQRPRQRQQIISLRCCLGR